MQIVMYVAADVWLLFSSYGIILFVHNTFFFHTVFTFLKKVAYNSLRYNVCD